jgi:hypothetical protein
LLHGDGEKRDSGVIATRRRQRSREHRSCASLVQIVSEHAARALLKQATCVRAIAWPVAPR